MKSNSISKEDKDFIQKVFNKAEYLEYLKVEEEIVIEKRKKMRIRTMKMIVALVLIFALTIILIKVTNYNFAVVLIMSINAIATSCFCEYREERVSI